MEALIWVGFSQSLFSAIIMFTKKDRSLPDKILSGWLVLLAIEFLACALNYKIFGNPVYSSSFLIFNPALYIYVSSLTRPNYKLRWIQLLHFLPFLLSEYYIYFIGQGFPMSSFFVRDEHFTFRLLFALTNVLSWSTYNPISVYLIIKYRRRLQKEVSNIEKTESLGWILALSIFYISYCSVVFVLYIFFAFLRIEPIVLHVFIYATLLVLIYMLSFYGLRQSVVSKQVEESDDESEPYKYSTLSAEAKQDIKEQIIKYFDKEKAYLLPDLNMDYLAKQLKIPKYQITEVLNTEIGKNFFQFVNSYRVDAVKEMLAVPQLKYSIEAIGYECGFSSKSSFYTVFKKITGETPVSYRKQLFL